MDYLYYKKKIEKFADENCTVAPGETDVVFLGDSLTDFCPLDVYYPEWKTLNRGIAGDTTDGLLQRMSVCAYEVEPKVVVLLIGDNNLQTMFPDYEEIIKGLLGTLPRTKIILVSLTPMTTPYAEKNPLSKRNNLCIKEIAERYGLPFVDLYDDLLDPATQELKDALTLLKKCGVQQLKDDYTYDGAHLTPDGYTVFTKKIAAAIRKVLLDK